MTINPDFRGADEVIVPGNIRDLCGWTDGHETEGQAIDRERRMADSLERDMPVATRISAPVKPMPSMWQAFNDYQKLKGRSEGSADWSLLDEFFGTKLSWLPQIIGSCVASNSFRPWVTRLMYQIVLLGKPQEYLGRSEFGPNNFSFFAPWSYGMARRRANMRGGDGLYCNPFRESLMKDGVLPCSTPKLVELIGSTARDYPEMQNAREYRRWGDWAYNDTFAPYSDYPVLSSPMVTSAAQLWDLIGEGSTAFVCSSEAIHKTGTHPDGFAIHQRNPRDVWYHNMSWVGRIVASNGDRFFRMSNESWGANVLYNRPYDEVEKSFRSGRPTCAAIADIRGPQSEPPTLG